jgi:hypothetical protein
MVTILIHAIRLHLVFEVILLSFGTNYFLNFLFSRHSSDSGIRVATGIDGYP